MIIKDIYLKKAKLSSLNGAIIFFTNEKFEINNTQGIINSKEKDIFKKNLKKVDLKKIHLQIAAKGHDTSEVSAKEIDYDELPECCKYSRKQ